MQNLNLLKQRQLENVITKRLQLTLENLNFEHDKELERILKTFTIEDRVLLQNKISDLNSLIIINANSPDKEIESKIKISIQEISQIIIKYLGFLDNYGNENPKGNAIESVLGYFKKLSGVDSGFVLDCKLSTLFLYWILIKNKIEANLIVRFQVANFETFSNKLAHPSVYIAIKEDDESRNMNLKGIKVDFTLLTPFFNVQNYLRTNDIKPFFINANSIQEAFIVLDILYTIGSSLVDVSKEINSDFDLNNILQAIIYFFSVNPNHQIVNAFKSNQNLIERFIENVVTVLSKLPKT